MSTVQKKQTNLREKLAELLDFRKMRDRLSGLGLYIGKDRTNTDENLLVRGGANVDDLQIGEIAALVGGTAVDVFVYDTSRDSDGGKWRERTQHTSWYNEELNTATRGARREFPAVAVIVAESNKVTIYDGDDPDLGMWMVFDDNNRINMIYGLNTNPSSISVDIVNARLCVATKSGDPVGQCGLYIIDFIKDSGHVVNESPAGPYKYNGNITQRNAALNISVEQSYYSSIVNQECNDVAMTILPNAPIDQNTGLPVPTIAVATDGGVSVIKDDGTVVDFTTTQVVEKIQINNTHIYFRIIEGSNSYVGGMLIPVQDASFTGNMGPESFRFNNSGWSSAFSYTGSAIIDDIQTNDSNVLNIGSSQFLAKITNDHFAGHKDLGSQCYITSKYNTGWMPGDIKLATLSDTTVENIGVNSDELVKNGEFSSNINESDGVGWDLVSGTQSISSGVLTIQPTTYGGVEQIINVLPHKRYIFNVVVHSTTTGTARIYIGDSSSQGFYYNVPSLTVGAYNFVFTTSSDTVLKIKLATTGQSGSNVSFSSTSLKQTTELITNGDFSIDAAAENFATAYPDWGTWLGTCSVDNNKLSVIVSGEGEVAAAATTNFSTVVGQRYVVSFDYGYDGGASHLAFWIDDTNATGQANIYNSGDILSTDLARSRSVSFTATSSTTYLVFLAYGTAGSNVHGEFYNISVRPATEADRSVNNNYLQVIGEIDKAPVAPGADLVAYSGFSANDYLVQPYNEDLNFGTGDFCVMGWVKLNDSYGTEVGSIVAIADPSIKFYFKVNHSTGGFSLFLNDATKITSQYTASSGSWAFTTVRRSNGKLSISVNAQKNDTDVDYADSIDMSSSQETSIGYRLSNSDAELAASLALLRISKTAPTDAQIAKIYRDEKALFQDGAQATLYGTSDSVTALAYDEKTELLHVGTTSGRSDFSGLRRINNTTTAITTSISAHNNLIAEQ